MTDFVNVECTAVPDGVFRKPEGLAVRLSLVLRPEPTQDSGAIVIQDWPIEVPTLDFEVSFGPDLAGLRPLRDQPAPAFDPEGASPDLAARAATAAHGWWRDRLWVDDRVRAAYVAAMEDRPAREPADVEVCSYTHMEAVTHHVVQSDVRTAATAMLLRGVDLNGLALPAKAAARLRNANSPPLRQSDALSLSQHPAFQGTDGGDALSRITMVTASERAAARAQLQALYAETRASVDKALRSPTGAASSLPVTTSRLNPFAPDIGDHDKSTAAVSTATAAAAMGERFDPAILGTPPALSRPAPAVASGATLAAAAPALAIEALRSMAIERSMASPDELDAEPEPPVDEAAELAQRHIAAFQAHPTLRKFVRLIVDIPINLSAIPEELRTGGVVSVTVKGRGKASRTFATAFVLRTSGDEEDWLFEPAAKDRITGENPSLSPSLPLEDGVVQLNIGRDGDTSPTPRFRLSMTDAHAAMMGMQRSLESTQRNHREGGRPDKAIANEQGLQTRGISLLDTEPNLPVQVEEARAALGSPATGTLVLLTAEDLVDSYRLDVVDPLDGVHPAGARTLRYSVIDALFEGEAHPPWLYPDVIDRDEGYLAPTHRHWREKPSPEHPDGREVIMTYESLVCWTGSNIGWPERWRDANGPRPPAEAGFGTTTTYGVKPGSLLPIARFHGKYRFMLRARKINGSSVPVLSSSRLVAKHALATPGDPKGLMLMPLERTRAPVVLVPRGERLSRPAGYDSPTSMAIMLGAGTSRAKRVLVSPHLGREFAELQRQFDPGRAPAGETPAQAGTRWAATARARSRGTYLGLRRTEGAFPAFGGQGSATGDALLFSLVDPGTAEPGNWPYHVDSSLRVVGMALKATGATPKSGVSRESTQREVAFWTPGASQRDLLHEGFTQNGMRPVLLEVAATTDGRSQVTNGPRARLTDGALAQEAETLLVELAPGHTCELEVWLTRNPHYLSTHPLLGAALPAALQVATALAVATGKSLGDRRGMSLSDASATVVERDRSERLAALHDVLRFRLEHAVPKPLQAPRMIELGATRAVDGAEWASISARPRDADRPGGATAFAWGSIRVDRLTTGRVWAECIWKECDPALVLRRTQKPAEDWEIDQDGLWMLEDKIGHGRLFDLDPVRERPAEGARDGDVIDLAIDEDGMRRALGSDFRGDRAMRVLVRLVGRSRFAKSYPPGGDDAHDEAEVTRDELVAALGRTTLPTGIRALWLKATRRPSAPSLVSSDGSLYHRQLGEPVHRIPRGHTGRTLTHTYRCWLDRDWFSSGEGEKLAIVCLDPSQTRQPNWVTEKLSRWGGDMTMRPGAPVIPQGVAPPGDPTFLRPSQILGATIGTAALPRPADLDAVAAVESRGVQLALVEPKFHTGVGRWYHDIALSASPAFRIGLQLSLARFQENAIDGCQLSDTVKTETFFLPQSWTFSAARRGAIVEVTAMGPAYLDRAPMTTGLAGAPLLSRVRSEAGQPLVTAELERLDSEAPIIVMGSDGLAVSRTNRREDGSTMEFGDQPGGEIPSGWSRWTMRLPIPPEEAERRLAVRFSVSSAHANLEALNGESDDGALVHLPEAISVQIVLPG